MLTTFLHHTPPKLTCTEKIRNSTCCLISQRTAHVSPLVKPSTCTGQYLLFLVRKNSLHLLYLTAITSPHYWGVSVNSTMKFAAGYIPDHTFRRNVLAFRADKATNLRTQNSLLLQETVRRRIKCLANNKTPMNPETEKTTSVKTRIPGFGENLGIQWTMIY